PAGATQLTFRDLIDRPGVARYRLELRGVGNRGRENNVWEGGGRGQAPALALLVNETGTADNLSRALASGKLRVTTATPAQLPSEVGGLLAFRGVILENVAASALGPTPRGPRPRNEA